MAPAATSPAFRNRLGRRQQLPFWGLAWGCGDQSGRKTFGTPGVSMTSGPMGEDEGLLTEEEAAAILQLSETTLRRLRLEGSGPPHVELGRQTRYRQAIVQGWLAGEAQRSSAADNR
jgi:predicted DNA-binding transcriptional regulator AlpA